MALLTVQPAAPLSALVESIWDCTLPRQAHAFDRLLPSAKPQLVINLAEDETRVYDDGLRCVRNAGAAFDAPSLRSILIDTAEQTAVLGIVFRPGAAAPFFRERMDALLGGHVDLDALAGGEARALRPRLLEAADARARLSIAEDWLRAGVERTGACPHPIVAHALRCLDHGRDVRRIAQIAADCGLSSRRLGTLFRERVGMPPKRYARLQRFHGVVAQAHRSVRVDWAAVAADGGFHDQSHLAHEFRAFSGTTPGAYLAGRGPWPTHLPVA